MKEETYIYILLFLATLLLLLTGYNQLAYNPANAAILGFIVFSISVGLSFLLLYYIVLFIIRKEMFNPILLFFPLLAALGYSLAKKAITGVSVQVLGSTGPQAALLQIVSLLSGYGTTIEIFGAWLGFIVIGASIALILFVLILASYNQIEMNRALEVAILAGFGIAAGFVTGHLATTSFLYPFAATGGPTIYIPVFGITLTIGLAALVGSIYLLRL
ncbi:MAG: hypothetical protein ACP5GJ_04050 [Nanopusillaceae archaeon]